MKLIDFIITLGETAIKEPDKYLVAGRNGPYNDPETPVRNKGHWLITLARLFEITHDYKYFNLVENLSDDLYNHEARPLGYSFHHRSKNGKDKCNGLIGQAWTFEALAYASFVINDPKYSELAEEVFFQHSFNYNCGLWDRLEIDGKVLSIDSTFNHQLWFAACASLLNTPRQDEISNRIFRFMNCLPENLSVLDNGLIYHPIERNLNQNSSRLFKKSKLRNIMKSFLPSLGSRKSQSNYNNKDYREKMINKSIGYHHFNMYAFAILKETQPDHSFWLSQEFCRPVNYLVSDEFKNEVSENIYGFPYNPPGFEVPYALSVLANLSVDELVDISSWWVNEQFNRCYNSETRMMDRNTNDPLTHTARIYEIIRLPISILERIEVNIQSIDDFAQIN
jgi:hypothetical protein